VSGIEVEGPLGYPFDFQYPWESLPQRNHLATIAISPFRMDAYPVTNDEYYQFLLSAGYSPMDPTNFLNEWVTVNGVRKYPMGYQSKPVVWVDRDDSYAFCSYNGGRLPHEWEWQYAAQYPDGRLYPWGNTPDASAVPALCKTRTMCPADDVDAHPSGGSYLGFYDLVGNRWQWTDEFVDDRTRGAAVRGGSSYTPQGSMWYFPAAYPLTTHGKLLLMSASMDRSGGIGFRCAYDD